MRRLGALVALLAAVFFAVAFPASAPSAHAAAPHTGVFADVDDFTFDSMTADYTLSRDADGTSHLDVVEQIVAVFPMPIRTAASDASSPRSTTASR